MKKLTIRQKLRLADGTNQIVKVHRGAFDNSFFKGHVVGMGPEFFALQDIDNGVRYNGYVCMRYSDVTRCELPAPYSQFYEKALPFRGPRPDTLGEVDFASLRTLLTTAAKFQYLLTISTEMDDPDEIYIGRFVACSEKELELLLIKPGARWKDGNDKIGLASITRVDFGGSYEEALWLVATSDRANSK